MRILGENSFNNNNELSKNPYIFKKVVFGSQGDASKLMWSRISNTAMVFRQNYPPATTVQQFLFYKDPGDDFNSDEFYSYVNESGKFFPVEASEGGSNRCEDCQVVDA